MNGERGQDTPDEPAALSLSFPPDDAAAQPLLAAAAALDPPPQRPAAEPRPIAARVESASDDVIVPSQAAELPGTHRGGFTRPPTAPVDVQEQVAQHEELPATTATLPTTDAASPANFATLSLGFAVVALIVAIVVGWGFPIGVGAVVLGLMSLRGRVESRPIAVWGVALGALSLIYSAGWLMYAAIQSGWIG
ncbi:hypothetical protein QE374_001143 [Microbacterium sp. SORGH_AS428]|uniref:hypothetical protein n=1 Tax=Microbacterium sp. SORGH_AS_0428 TaxID=3041788 RepID=UPI00285A8E87|nr:hypothetical protein [Microbacterium sp. SORGH_AS_0428]MDR6199234.1 hypothetical protein [Microbacterium sp. SORGH_AS_0428]